LSKDGVKFYAPQAASKELYEFGTKKGIGANLLCSKSANLILLVAGFFPNSF
jgi:hypothetical protein